MFILVKMIDSFAECIPHGSFSKLVLSRLL